MKASLGVAAALAMLAAHGIQATVAQPGATEVREGQQTRQGGEKERGNGQSLADRLAAQRAVYGVRVPPRRGGYLNRAGWTNRGYQRAAAKRRNQARHRAACR